MELNIANGGQTVSVSEAVFDRPYNETLVHQVVTAYLAGARAGTKAQKNRSEVRGGGKKPWRQKGTGRARAGTIRSPLWVGGGMHFAAKPRDFSQKVNRKMYRAGIRSIVSELARQERLVIIEDLELAGRKTKGLIEALSNQGVNAKGLLIASEIDDNLGYSANNIVDLDVISVRDIDPVSLVGAEQVLMTQSSLAAFEGWLS